MKAWLVKPVKHDVSSHSSVFTPVSPISKTEILSGKYPVKFYWILQDSGILPDTGIRIQYIPNTYYPRIPCSYESMIDTLEVKTLVCFGLTSFGNKKLYKYERRNKLLSIINR